MKKPKLEEIKPIPVRKYLQTDAGAAQYRNDCGAGMGMTILSAYKKTSLTVTQFHEKVLTKMGFPIGSDVYLSISGIQSVLRDEGVNTTTAAYQSMPSLFQWLYEGKPIGILINNYGILVDAGLTEYKTFRGSHFVTAVGVLLGREQYIGIFDPYTTTDEISFWDTKNFYDAWSWGQAGNAPRQVLLPMSPWAIDNFNPVPDEPPNLPPPTGTMVYEVVCNALTVRSGGNSSYKAIGYIHRGERVNALEILQNGWLKLERGGYCSGSAQYIKRIY